MLSASRANDLGSEGANVSIAAIGDLELLAPAADQDLASAGSGKV